MTIDPVLFDFWCAAEDAHGADEPPPPAFVDAWCERFPSHAAKIRRDVSDEVRRQIARGCVPLHYRSATRGR